MENQQGTSFIPKSPTRASVKPKGVRQVFILTYVTSIFFFGTIIAAVVIFIWSATLGTQLDATKSSLAEKKTAFNQQGLEQVREINKRLAAATNLLNTQVSATKLFTALESDTYLPIQITGFDYQKNDAGAINLALAIRARTFNDALAQRESLLADDIFAGATISTPAFVNPVPPDDAPYLSAKEITFVLEKELMPTDIKYDPPEAQETQSAEDYFADSFQEGAIENGLNQDADTQSAPIVEDQGTQDSVPEVQPVDITDSITN